MLGLALILYLFIFLENFSLSLRGKNLIKSYPLKQLFYLFIYLFIYRASFAQ